MRARFIARLTYKLLYFCYSYFTVHIEFFHYFNILQICDLLYEIETRSNRIFHNLDTRFSFVSKLQYPILSAIIFKVRRVMVIILLFLWVSGQQQILVLISIISRDFLSYNYTQMLLLKHFCRLRLIIKTFFRFQLYPIIIISIMKSGKSNDWRSLNNGARCENPLEFNFKAYCVFEKIKLGVLRHDFNHFFAHT